MGSAEEVGKGWGKVRGVLDGKVTDWMGFREAVARAVIKKSLIEGFGGKEKDGEAIGASFG